MAVRDGGSTGEFYDVVFSKLVAEWYAIIYVSDGSSDALAEAHFFRCQFLDSGATTGVFVVGIAYDLATASFYDSLFERNTNGALFFLSKRMLRWSKLPMSYDASFAITLDLIQLPSGLVAQRVVALSSPTAAGSR